MYDRVPAEFYKALTEGRLLLLSSFNDAERRVTAELAAYRNRFVAALADRVLFVHAAPGGRTEALALEVIGWGKPVYTLGHEANANLVALGPIPLLANFEGIFEPRVRAPKSSPANRPLDLVRIRPFRP